jgi:hypothetical protein
MAGAGSRVQIARGVQSSSFRQLNSEVSTLDSAAWTQPYYTLHGTDLEAGTWHGRQSRGLDVFAVPSASAIIVADNHHPLQAPQGRQYASLLPGRYYRLMSDARLWIGRLEQPSPICDQGDSEFYQMWQSTRIKIPTVLLPNLTIASQDCASYRHAAVHAHCVSRESSQSISLPHHHDACHEPLSQKEVCSLWPF